MEDCQNNSYQKESQSFFIGLSSSVLCCKFHIFADDMQIYLSFRRSNIFSMISRVNTDIEKTNLWASSNDLRLIAARLLCLVTILLLTMHEKSSGSGGAAPSKVYKGLRTPRRIHISYRLAPVVGQLSFRLFLMLF